MQNIKIATCNSEIKYHDRDDLLFISFDNEADIAAIFTQSSVRAAPVKWCQNIIKHQKIKALLVNAGNANCYTGNNGKNDISKKIDKISKILNCNKEHIYICSTGVIGEKLQIDKIINKIDHLNNIKDFNDNSFTDSAKSIMTTDTIPKYLFDRANIDDNIINIHAIAKGSGMIAPNMATLLSFIFCDANIEPQILSKLLKDAADLSFNSITIDSDQSTNDSLFLISTKTANNKIINNIDDPRLDDFKSKLNKICLDLAKLIVLDGEGVKKIIEINVNKAPNKKLAKKIAFSIGNSPLVKSAIAANDPNWGRIIAAIGKSYDKINQDIIDLDIGNHIIISKGELSNDYQESIIHNYLKNEYVTINVTLNIGNDNATIYSSDLNEEYVTINKDYRS